MASKKNKFPLGSATQCLRVGYTDTNSSLRLAVRLRCLSRNCKIFIVLPSTCCTEYSTDEFKESPSYVKEFSGTLPPVSSTSGQDFASRHTPDLSAANWWSQLLIMSTDQTYFESAIGFWKDVALSSLQREWEEKAKSITTGEKKRITSRKNLAEQTRVFKKIPDQDKAAHVKGLLKGYQNEIDTITKAAKESETAFLKVYKALIDAPDPAPLFEVAIDQSEKMIDKDLLQQNEALQRELKDTKESLKRLEASTKQDTKSENFSQKEQMIKNQYDEKLKFYVEREHDLQRQLSLALDQLNLLRDTHDDAQDKLINHNQKYEKDVAVKLAELDVVIMDLDRANDTIGELRSKNEDLRRLNEELSQANTVDNGIVDESQQNEALIRLQQEVDRYKDLCEETKNGLSKKIKNLTGENDKIKKQLEKFKNYPEIERELDIMKQVLFSTGDDEDGDPLDANKGVWETLEAQLLDKNKKLESEKTLLKVQTSDLQSELESRRQELGELQSKYDVQLKLVNRLEEDLLRMGQNPPLSPNPPKVHEDPAANNEGEVKSDYIKIIVDQRDRFKKQKIDIEEKYRDLEKRMGAMKEEVARLTGDNMDLSERLKFVHVWKNEERGPVNGSTTINMYDAPDSSRQTLNSREDPTQKYAKLHDENMNPFNQFRRKEERRRYNAMSVTDRLTLKLTRMMVSHKSSRYFLVVYALLLHLLVVVTLYQLSLWECRHDHEMLGIPIINDDTAAKLAQLPDAM